MKKHKLRLLSLLLLLGVCNATAATSVDISKAFLDRSFWTDFDWNSAKVSDIWAEPGFGNVDMKAAPDKQGRRNQRRRELTIDGITYIATLGEHSRSTKPDFASLEFKDRRTGDCERMFKVLDKRFSSEAGPFDNKWFASPGVIGVDRTDWQWEAGTTRVSLQCVKVPGNNVDLATAQFEGAIDASKIEGPINLLCDYDTMEAADTAHQWMKAQPFVLTAIPMYKIVTDADRVSIGQLDSMSGTTLGITIFGKDRTTSLSVSRLDGTLVGMVTSSDSKTKIAALQGSCERHDPSDRKF